MLPLYIVKYIIELFILKVRPAIRTYKALKFGTPEDIKNCTKFWVVIVFLELLGSIIGSFLWIPFYSVFSLAANIIIFYFLGNASYLLIYDYIVGPLMEKHIEKLETWIYEIDRGIEKWTRWAFLKAKNPLDHSDSK